MSPIERAAKALFMAGVRTSALPGLDAKESSYADWARLGPELEAGFVADVKLVLQAIREPSEAMCRISARKHGYNETDPVEWSVAASAWQAMIDEILGVSIVDDVQFQTWQAELSSLDPAARGAWFQARRAEWDSEFATAKRLVSERNLHQRREWLDQLEGKYA